MRTKVEVGAVAGAAVAVIVMIAVAVVRIADEPGDASTQPPPVVTIVEGSAGAPTTPDPARTTSSPMVASPTPITQALADVAFVDLDGGGGEVPVGVRAFEGLSGLQAAPDGRRLAFSHDGRLYVASVDGGRIVPVTPSVGASSPAWSPDGRRLVFTAGDSIQIVDISSGRVTSLLLTDGPLFRPAFAPDGRTILFTAPRGPRLWLWEVPIVGGAARPLFGGAFGVYSPDGDVIAFRATGFDGEDPTEMTSSNLLVAGPDGSLVQHVPGRMGSMSQVDPLALWPSWSPDGTQLAYQPMYGRTVLIIDVATGRRTDAIPISDDLDPNPAPTWLDNDTVIILRRGVTAG